MISKTASTLSFGRRPPSIGLTLAAALMVFTCADTSAMTVREVDCDRGESLQDVFRPGRVAPRDIVVVRGTCRENVEISEGFDGVTIDGQGTATIDGPDASVDTLRLVGVRNFTVRGLTILGGRDGVNLRAAVMVSIQGNVIRAGRDGVQVHRGSFALITNNVLQNGRDGIVVHESSAARIGFSSAMATAPSPNLIERNGRNGVLVSRASTVRIAGNTIRNNRGSGIRVERVSQADIAFNRIEANGEDGIRVLQNSGVNLGTVTTGHFLDLVNITDQVNTGVGIRGQVGGYAVGALGSLNGTVGQKNFSDASAGDRLTP